MFDSLLDLISVCRQEIVNSPYVTLQLENLSFFYDSIKGAEVPSHSYLLHPKSSSITHNMFDFTFNASLNGGYYYYDNGNIKQWNINGSGSNALFNWIDKIRENHLMPLYDIKSCDIYQSLSPYLRNVPYAAKRLKICSEFSDNQKFNQLDDFVFKLINQDSIHVSFETINNLIQIYPEGFAEDPFKKKAILALIFFTDHLENLGKKVIWEAGLAVDYQIPRILTWANVIKLSDYALDLLKSDKLLSVSSDFVIHYRAATLLAVEELSKQTNVSSKKIDGVLFNKFRKDSNFLKNSPPNMKIDEMWF